LFFCFFLERLIILHFVKALSLLDFSTEYAQYDFRRSKFATEILLRDHDHILCKRRFELALAKNFRVLVLKETEESGHGPLLVYV